MAENDAKQMSLLHRCRLCNEAFWIGVVAANEHRSESGHLRDEARKALCDIENDIFLIHAAASRRSRVVTAMPGVDDDNDVTAGIPRGYNAAVRRRRLAQVDNEAMPVATAGRQGK